MNCPVCGSPSTRVVDTTRGAKGIRRRRQCKECGHRFSTMERPILTSPLVVKRDGHREGFEREKLISGLRIACARRPVSADDLEKLADRVEAYVLQLGKAEVSSRLIGDRMSEELKELDPVSYIRYAIVYLGLEDLDAVQDEIDRLLAERD